jgi:hypothetical protein
MREMLIGAFYGVLTIAAMALITAPLWIYLDRKAAASCASAGWQHVRIGGGDACMDAEGRLRVLPAYGGGK